MNILITGANGFIGRHLVDRLLSKGHNIRGTARNTGSRKPGEDIKSIEWASLNLERPDNDYGEILRDIDVVVHLAARVHNPKEEDRADIYNIINTEGTRSLMLNAENFGVKRFIFISSIKVVGEGVVCPDGSEPVKYSEVTEPDPRGVYEKSKYAAEKIIQQRWNDSSMDYIIIRPPLVYGPWVKGNFLSLMNAVYNRYPLPLAGIKNKRSLVYVKNLCGGIESSIEHPDAAQNIFHICDSTLSIVDLVKRIAASLGKQNVVFPFPVALLRYAASMLNRKEMIDRLTESLPMDDSKIRRMLSWTPEYTLDEGMETTAKWFLGSKNREQP